MFTLRKYSAQQAARSSSVLPATSSLPSSSPFLFYLSQRTYQSRFGSASSSSASEQGQEGSNNTESYSTRDNRGSGAHKPEVDLSKKGHAEADAFDYSTGLYGKRVREAYHKADSDFDKRNEELVKKGEKDKAQFYSVTHSGGRATRGVGEPIHNRYRQQTQLDTLRYGTKEHLYMPLEDQVKWMKVKDAAVVLDLDPDKLYGLRKEEIVVNYERALRTGGARLTLQQEQDIEASYEVLMNYIHSGLYVDQTKAHYTEHISKARREVRDTLAKEKTERAWAAANVFTMMLFASIAAIVILGFILWRYMANMKQDDEGQSEMDKNAIRLTQNAMLKIRDTFNQLAMRRVNYEPAPDYTTRARDTPTQIDLIMEKAAEDDIDPEMPISQREEAQKHQRLLRDENDFLVSLERIGSAETTLSRDGLAQLREHNVKTYKNRKFVERLDDQIAYSGLPVLDKIGMSVVPGGRAQRAHRDSIARESNPDMPEPEAEPEGQAATLSSTPSP